MESEQFAVCVRNDGDEVSLERRKIYQMLPDPEAEKHGDIRIVDGSGEDYLYSKSFFAPIELPQPLRRAVLAAAYQAALAAFRHAILPCRSRSA